MTRPLRQARWFALRHAALHLDRPGNQTRVVLLAVGLGAFFIVGVRARAVEPAGRVLVRPGRRHARHVPDRHPARPGRRAAARSCGPRAPPAAHHGCIPVLRARVTGVHGREVTLESVEDVRGPRVARARVHHHLPRCARSPTSASWTAASGTAAPSAQPEVSIEQSIRERFRIDDRRHDALRRAGPAHRGPRHQRALGELARRRATAGSCSCSARALFEQAPHGVHRLDARARGRRRSARGCSATWSRRFPTCRSSTSARCSRPSGT